MKTEMKAEANVKTNSKAKWNVFKNVVLIVTIAVFFITGSFPNVHAIASTTTQIAFYVDSPYVMVNDHTVNFDTPPIIVNDKVYVPIRNMSDYMGLDLSWNSKLQLVELKTAKVTIQFDMDNKKVIVNGVASPIENVATVSNERLLVRLEWFADYAGAKQIYEPSTKRVDIIYVKQPDVASDAANSSRPVAKFTFAKSSYRLGETVKYVDLSYDPDAEGIARYEWTGKKDAFFSPGKYLITLKVYDNKGHESEVYSRYLTIENTPYLNEVEYKIYNQPVGTSFKTDWSMLYKNFMDLPILQKKVDQDKSRTLVVSDSPETFMEKGILYKETIKGKARLYADHVNGTSDKIQFFIMARNTTTHPVTIKTTNKGEVYPSIYANLIGNEASIDFMLHDSLSQQPLVVPAGQSRVYVQMPNFFPGQGVNVFYDVETDGAVEFSFVAGDSGISTPTTLGFYKQLAFDGHVRGTFPVSDMTWNVDLSGFVKPSRLVIGDGESDAFVKGYDGLRHKEVLNEGNYGMIYRIHADKPRKMAVLLLARGGAFKGPFKINGDFMMAPASGVIQAFESIQVLARTTGKEDSFDIELTPPAGSAFPIDIIFYPLSDLK